MINRAVLTGRLTKEPEIRVTNSGKKVVSFTLAVNRNFKNANGEVDADFINCVLWGESTQNFVTYVHKGSLIGIDGRIQTRNYEDNDGKRVYVTEVLVERFTFLEKKDAGYNLESRGFTDNSTTIPSENLNLSDDDLPF